MRLSVSVGAREHKGPPIRAHSNPSPCSHRYSTLQQTGARAPPLFLHRAHSVPHVWPAIPRTGAEPQQQRAFTKPGLFGDQGDEMFPKPHLISPKLL